MSGHSHWARIRHKKGATDAKRGRLFSKLVRDIMVAAKHGGGDPAANLRLQCAIDAAKAASLPKDTIERAVKKGTGELAGENYEEVTYEGYSAGGAALMVEVLTNNRNRTASEIRKIFETRGGNLAGAGAVSWMFQVKGVILVDAAQADEDTVLEVVIEVGAENMENDNGTYSITCAPQDLQNIKKALEEKNITVESAAISKVPQNYLDVGPEQARRAIHLMQALEDNEDVQNIYSNFNIPPEVLKEIEAEGG